MIYYIMYYRGQRFDPKVNSVESWSKKALEDLKPLLLSTEAIDTEPNLMIIIKAEINRRLQAKIGLSSAEDVVEN